MLTTKIEKAPSDTSGWLTREQSADLLGVSHTTIKNWQEAEILKPELGRRGGREVWLYNPHELAKVPRRKVNSAGTSSDPGEIAARAFERFSEGETIRDVVVHLRIVPERAAELHDQWELMGGAEMVINAAARRELSQILGPFDGVAGLVEAARQAVRAATDPLLVAPRDASIIGDDQEDATAG